MRITCGLMLIALVFITSFSCKEDDLLVVENSVVEMFEVDAFETIADSDHIDPVTVKTKNTPLFQYEDLLSYNSKEYKFELSKHAKVMLENTPINSGAFAVKVDGEIIYTGYFVPGYSSRLYAWNIIDPLHSSATGDCFVRRIEIQGSSRPYYEDKRNDARIIQAFRQSKKLIE